ncbi:zinc-binding dehydrogenase [Streptomyces sp. NPDC046862]|uniref:alcohol dehydrogenase catalytic domain-containing protein n=1 Tax=Streptomyces sp. NPDC046862 TaxID=3154603 RepID=UPI003455B30B
MKAFTVAAFGARPLLCDDVPEPTAGPGEVLVRVQASSVNWLDSDIAHGMFEGVVPPELPINLGRDFAGTVEALGDGVCDHGPGRTNVAHGPCPEILGRVARHLADGTITIDIQRSYDLTEAAEALRALATHHTRGKIALRVA